MDITFLAVKFVRIGAPLKVAGWPPRPALTSGVVRLDVPRLQSSSAGRRYIAYQSLPFRGPPPMYVPPHFAGTDQKSTLHAFVERFSFGPLVSRADGEPFATHLPFLLDRAAGPHGTLAGHLARANPQWRGLAGRTVLGVFSGPHAYISPTWYEAENVVPTWKYTAVHAYGPAEVVEDRDALLGIVQRSVAVYEAGMPRPWPLDPDGRLVDGLLPQIVGFRVRVDRLEGKWELGQNHPPDRRHKVIRALRETG